MQDTAGAIDLVPIDGNVEMHRGPVLSVTLNSLTSGASKADGNSAVQTLVVPDGTVHGTGGDDTVHAGAGDDKIITGAGDDPLEGGAESDKLSGGDGDDTLIYSVGDGSDTITDFNFGNSSALGDGDTTNNDFIDLSGYYDNQTELREDFNDDGVLNQSNRKDNDDTVDYTNNAEMQAGDGITFQSADQSSFSADKTGVVCFTTGAAIRTPHCDVLIDHLRVDDLVSTLDNGPQPIRWVGRTTFSPAALAQNPRLPPLLPSTGTLGAARDLLVSRQHGILTGQDHHCRAIHLSHAIGKVRVARGKGSVTYVHLMFEARQIIFAEDVPAESFYPGPTGLRMMSQRDRDSLLRSVPDVHASTIRTDVVRAYGDTARTFVTKRNLRHIQTLRHHALTE
ncbi:MAG: Hint domain-containing protein [Pseudomonadota bacterium]